MERNHKYQHVIFDLDHTLWDFNSNSKQTLQELYFKYKLDLLESIDLNHFHQKFLHINSHYWEMYRQGLISKKFLREDRFRFLMHFFGVDDQVLISSIADDYVQIGPTKSALMPHAMNLLHYLKQHYQLHIITNGFTDVQYIKMKSSGIDVFFTHIVTSELAGVKKPDPKIFQYALNVIKADAQDCIMIGDELQVDIVGAKNCGIDQIFFNTTGISHKQQLSYEVHSLNEIFKIL